MTIGLSHGLNGGDSAYADATSTQQKEGSFGPSVSAPYKMTAQRLIALIIASLVTAIIVAADAPTHALRLLFYQCM
jgi:hypothetical protein